MWKRVLKNRLKVNNYTIYHILLFYKAIKLYLFKFTLFFWKNIVFLDFLLFLEYTYISKKARNKGEI